MKIAVLAPNWLGDAVLALPAVDGVRRAHPTAHLTAAARPSVADLFRLVPTIDAVMTLQSDARWWRRDAFRADVDALRPFDAALLLPNSFRSAWIVRTAGVRERWGYAADARTRLLTRAVRRTPGGHQSEYYQRLVAALDMPSSSSAPAIDIADHLRAKALDLLAQEGYRAGAPLVVLAPGAAYGKAKQWIPDHVAALIARLTGERRATCVLAGSRGDAATCRDIRRLAAKSTARPVLDLSGRTSLETLAALFAVCDACVSNDSGAMHLAAAVGAPVIAAFGPTNELATRPLPRTGRPAEVLTNPVWCRPCMLRECPIDHRCMTGLTPDRVFAAVAAVLGR